ncbi:MAG: nucleoside triphosphate pyrophosphohydrolase family protein [Trueperaceae bacterium]|nr:nucleoside triphosphate pyrophosphohydrolase family protein [Trueperaceae bacterium]
MTLDAYQAGAKSTALYSRDVRILYPALKLAGEAGEVAEKLGKFMRDEGYRPGDELNAEQREKMVKELGDVLWYVANLAADLGVSLEHVAAVNLEKLQSRKARGVIGGSGDDR